ncbi:MAG: DUF2267 domain-containing protein [Bacteriovorax sp.]
MFNKEENPNAAKSEPIKGQKISNHVSAFERSLQKSETWISQMQYELKWLNGDSTYHLLRAVLHALRDQLSIDEAAHFSAQLPLLLKGTFYECWNPQKNHSKALSKKEFLEAVMNHLGPVGSIKFELETGVSAALGVIMNHISGGEMNDIVQSSKDSLKAFFNIVENFNRAQKFQ